MHILVSCTFFTLRSYHKPSSPPSLRLRTVPFLVGSTLCPLVGLIVCRWGSRPGLLAMAAALCCLAHGIFPPDVGATIPKIVILSVAEAYVVYSAVLCVCGMSFL